MTVLLALTTLSFFFGRRGSETDSVGDWPQLLQQTVTAVVSPAYILLLTILSRVFREEIRRRCGLLEEVRRQQRGRLAAAAATVEVRRQQCGRLAAAAATVEVRRQQCGRLAAAAATV